MGVPQVAGIVHTAFEIIFNRAPREDEILKPILWYISLSTKLGEDYVAAAPKTLFVFAAGNNGVSNDILGTVPANIKAPNTISVAAPLVARIAGLVKDANPDLTPAQMKEIIMGTVDKKEFLKDRVTTGGIVNQARAVRAANLSVFMGLKNAIKRSHQAVSPEESRIVEKQSMMLKSIKGMLKKVVPVPLPSMYGDY